MKHILTLIVLITISLTSCQTGKKNETKPKEKESSKPNIIFIMADDLGYGDLSCYGATKIKTPNIDKLAKKGIKLTDAHSPSAVCTPTRYGVLTGRYSWRGRLKKEVLWSGYDRSLIEKDRKTIGNLMKESGYATAHIGKWHLGWEDEEPVDYSKGYLGRGPKDLGFDYSFVTASAHNLFPIVFVENHQLVSNLKPMDYYVYEPGNETPDEIYEWHRTKDKGPMMIADDWQPDKVDSLYGVKAKMFIEDHIMKKTNQPFYMHLTPEAPHLPNNVPDFMKGKSEAGTRGDHVQMLDWVVGDLIDKLKELDIEKNTLVIITSDNGPRPVGIDGNIDGKYLADYEHDFEHKSAGNLRGFKARLWEGGHRVPFIAQWPNKIGAGQISNNLICLTDMMATFSEIIGYHLDATMGEDSFNALPIILGEDKEIRENIIHQDYEGNLSIREGHYKLLGESLYNISKDLGENKNIAALHPQKVLDLKQLLKTQVENKRTAPVN
ncbi:arylsulfatase [Sabulilitoribacter arenilitoris]|uniref:Arylsulfatase n=1 Tax=Wocania arenilitoris TaxID=2044858 RepID=A0AAE3EMN1_9FLAO|nr:arylsulfatase [Wocania arenilitoris]MCF7567044.1 arylsulfatase [Wocania arenilitoris]